MAWKNGCRFPNMPGLCDTHASKATKTQQNGGTIDPAERWGSAIIVE